MFFTYLFNVMSNYTKGSVRYNPNDDSYKPKEPETIIEMFRRIRKELKNKNQQNNATRNLD